MNGIDIALIANLTLVGLIVIVVISALIGLWKGIWKTSFKLCFRSILFIVMVFCAQPIANGVCNIDFANTFNINLNISGVQFTTINETIAKILVNSGKISPISGQSLYETCFAIGHSLASFAIFFIIMILTLIFGSLLATLFYHAVFKHLVPKKIRKTKKLRIFGAITGTVDGLLCAVMLISPLSTMANVLTKHDDAIQAVYDSKILSESAYNAIMDGLDGYRKSALYSTMKGLDPVSSGIMNQVVEIELNGVKTGFLAEIDALLDIVTPIVSYVDFNDGQSPALQLTSLMAKDNVTRILSILANSHLVIGIIPGLISMGQAMISDPTIEDIISRLDFSDIDWSNDLVALGDFYGTIHDAGIISFEGNKLNFGFDITKLSEYKIAVNKIIAIDAIKQNLASVMAYSADYLNQALNAPVFSTSVEDYQDLDWEHDLTCFVNAVTGVFDALEIKSFDNLDFETLLSSALSDNTKIEKLKKAIVGTSTELGLLDLNLLDTAVQLDSLAISLLEPVQEIKDYVDAEIIKDLFDGTIELKSEFSTIFDLIPLVNNNPNLPLDAIDLTNTKHIEELKKCVDIVADSSILRAVFPGLIESSLKSADISEEMLFGLSLDLLNFHFDSGEELRTEMNRILDLTKLATDLTSILNDKTLKPEDVIRKIDLNSLKQIMVAMYESKIVNPPHRVVGDETIVENHNFFAFISGIMSQQSLVDLGVLVPDNLENIAWLDQGSTKGEISRIIDSIAVLQEEAEFFLNGKVTLSNIEGATIKKILQVFGESSFFSYSLASIFNTNVAPMINDLGITIDFSNVTDWSNEGDCLAKIIDSLKVISADGDLTKIDWLNSDLTRVNAILTAFAQTDIMSVTQDETGRYVDQFGSLLATVFTGDSFEGVLGNSIDSSYFQSNDPMTGANIGWRWIDEVENVEITSGSGESEKVETAEVTKFGEINNLVNILENIQTFGVDNINSGGLDPIQLKEVLLSVVRSNTLTDVIPDLLESSLKQIKPIELDTMNTVKISDLNSAVFHDLTLAEKETEITYLTEIYADFKTGDLEILFKNANKLSEDDLDKVKTTLDNMARLQSFTVAKVGASLSLYEEIISSFLSFIQLDQMVTNNVTNVNDNDYEIVRQRAKNQMRSIISGVSDWLDVTVDGVAILGENSRLIDVMRSLTGIDLNKLNDFNSLSPDQLTVVLGKINESILCHQAVPTFFEQAFTSFNISALTEIESTKYYPINYRVHLSNSETDLEFWKHEITALCDLAAAIYDKANKVYFDFSSLGFGNTELYNSVKLYELLIPIDHMELLTENKEYIVYNFIKNTDQKNSANSLVEMVRDMPSGISVEHVKAARIRKLFFPIGHSDEDLKLQCELLEAFLDTMSRNIDVSFTGSESLNGDLGYRFITSTFTIESAGSDVKKVRSLFASEIVASYFTKGFESLLTTEEDADTLNHIRTFFFDRDDNGWDYKNLGLVEARGIKGLLYLARATTLAEMADALELMGNSSATIENMTLPIEATEQEKNELALLKQEHRMNYSVKDGGKRDNNSKIALYLFEKYFTSNAAITGLVGTTPDITSSNFLFEDYAATIRGLIRP